MADQSIYLDIVGTAYQHPKQDVNFQKSINVFPIYSGDGGRGEKALVPTPGLKSIITLPTAPIRAVMKHNTRLFAIGGNKFYELTLNEDTLLATAEEKGTIRSLQGNISWDINTKQLMMVDSSVDAYVYDVTTDTFTVVEPPNFFSGKTIIFMDGFFIYNVPNTATMYATNLGNGLITNALDFTGAETRPDNIIGLGVLKGNLWVFGEESIEVWQNTANSIGFPFSKLLGVGISQGCSAPFSIILINDTLVWLDDRGYIVKSVGYNLEIMSTEAINNEIAQYKRIDDAVAFSYNDRGQLFYQITFPTANKTWVYSATSQLWHERAFFDANKNFIAHRSRDYVSYKRHHLVGDFKNGKIYDLSQKYKTDDGNAKHAVRTTAHFYNEFNLLTISG